MAVEDPKLQEVSDDVRGKRQHLPMSSLDSY